MRTCAACTHPQRSRIDEGIAEGRNQSELGRDFGLHRKVIARHILAGHARLSSTPAAGDHSASPAAPPLVELVQALRSRALQGDPASARELRLTVQALEASTAATAPAVDLVDTAEWRELRGRILRALDQHPEAKLAVVLAMAGEDAP